MANTTYEAAVEIRLPSLLIASDAYETHIALGRSLRYQLQTFVNNTKKNMTSFSMLHDFIISKIAEVLTEPAEDFNILSIWDWALLIFCIMTIFNFILNCHNKYQIRALILLMGRNRVEASGPSLDFFAATDDAEQTALPDPSKQIDEWQMMIKSYVSEHLVLLLILLPYFIGTS